MLGDQNIYVINGIKVLKMYKINIWKKENPVYISPQNVLHLNLKGVFMNKKWIYIQTKYIIKVNM